MTNYADTNPFELQGKGIISLLEPSGAYDVDRYPWAYQAWKRQQQIHWMGEEVPLGSDLNDWQSNILSDGERNLLLQIFRFLNPKIESISLLFTKYFFQ